MGSLLSPPHTPQRGPAGREGGARVQAHTITTLSWGDKGQAPGPGSQLPRWNDRSQSC